MAHARVPPRIRRVQASALALLVIAGTLNYVDRAALSIANPLIREELGLSISDMGLLLSAFLWAYAFSQLPGGAMTSLKRVVVDPYAEPMLMKLDLGTLHLHRLARPRRGACCDD